MALLASEGGQAGAELHYCFVAGDVYEIDHCTALGPCSTRHMIPTSEFVGVWQGMYLTFSG